MLESKQNRLQQIFPIQDNSSCSGPIGPMIKLIQILLDKNNLPKFSADWSILADDKSVNEVKYNSFLSKWGEQINLTILS